MLTQIHPAREMIINYTFGRIRKLSYELRVRSEELGDEKDLPSSPNPESQIWDSGSQNFKVPLPDMGEGFRVRAKTTVLNLDQV